MIKVIKDKTNLDLLTIEVHKGQSEMVLTNLGAGLISFIFNEVELIVGPKNIHEFIKEGYYGKTIGRTSGRLFTPGYQIKDNFYEVTPFRANDSSLHGGEDGIAKQYFVVSSLNEGEKEDIVTFELVDREGTYPGDLNLTVVYRLSQDNRLRIEFIANSNKDTLCNLTNHAYFNLGEDTIKRHLFKMRSSSYLLTDENFHLLGVKPTQNTAFDFNELTPIEKNLNQIKDNSFFGYDHCFYLDEKRLSLYSNQTKIGLNMTTSYPCVVIYTHNVSSPDNLPYFHTLPYKGLTLEAQYEPGGIHHKHLNDGILEKNKTYEEYISYQFYQGEFDETA